MLQKRYMARKTNKMCLVCGNQFMATASGQTCSGACRVSLKRIIDSGKKPDFYLVAKSKGQKVPDLLVEKLAKKSKSEKPKEKPVAEVVEQSNIPENWATMSKSERLKRFR